MATAAPPIEVGQKIVLIIGSADGERSAPGWVLNIQCDQQQRSLPDA